MAKKTVVFLFAFSIFFSALTPNLFGQKAKEIIPQIVIPAISILGRKPKAKDYNKPPDMNEFREPVEGEFVAKPVFIYATTDSQRCQAIDLWLSSVRYEASRSTEYGASRSSYLWNNGVLDMAKVNADQLPKFGTASFRSIFGKGLNEFSEKEMKEVAKRLDQCSHQMWVTGTLQNWFENPATLQNWIVGFNNIENDIKKERVAEKKRLYDELYRLETAKTGYAVAELLKESSALRLHASFLNNGSIDWCAPDNGHVIVGAIFKGDGMMN